VLAAKEIAVSEHDQLYFNVRSVVAGVCDKATKQRSSVKKGPNPIWNEQFIFDVIDPGTQVVEFHFWSKQLLPNSGIAKLTLVLKEILPNLFKEMFIDEHTVAMTNSGKIVLKLHFLPTLT